MNTLITKISKQPVKDNIVLLIENIADIKKFDFSKEETEYLSLCINEGERKNVTINRYSHFVFVIVAKNNNDINKGMEAMRKEGHSLQKTINGHHLEAITIADLCDKPQLTLALAEGIALSNYQFLKYKTVDVQKKSNKLKTINIVSEKLKTKEVEMINIAVEATYISRDLVNEPLSSLNAVELSDEIRKMGEISGFKVEVFNKNRIEALKMGGLIAVNKGSIDPPTFSVLEWHPEKPINDKPYIFVGKGVVFDTGGMNLKPGTSMDGMKCDMSGAAAVAGAMYAIAKAHLPIHVIGLIPATDNRPDGNAEVPGNVIEMHNGITVEIISTDAEGRLILGDALSYAQKYKPELVIDIATLTGAASRAIGKYGMVSMGNNDKWMEELKKSGNEVCERLAEFPFWDEYDDLIKSDIADIKNIGAPEAGAITAGKFLEHFVDYPWIHLDIAGPAFMDNAYNYRGTGGTGVGVRLFFNFIQNILNKKK